MRFKDVFSIIGPSMVGPSSSHTAGAARIGRVARHFWGEQPDKVEITFYGSFAETYQGHGTDVAIIAGLLDYNTDDPRIPNSFEEAEKLGMEFTFKASKAMAIHPNTAQIILYSEKRQGKLLGASIGGGNIEILHVNDFDVKFTGSYPTLVVFHEDRPGMIFELSQILNQENANIGYMDVDRKGRSGEAVTVIELDSPITAKLLQEIEVLSRVEEVRGIDITEGSHA